MQSELTPLSRALKNGNASVVKEILKDKTALNLLEKIQYAAATNWFLEEDFKKLTEPQKEVAYRTANLWCWSTRVIQVMNEKGMLRPIISPVSPSVVSPFADTDTLKRLVHNYFWQLRQAGKVECSKALHPAHWKVKPGFERIQGGQHVERCIDRLGLKRIKVPQAIAALMDTQITIQVVWLNEYLALCSPQIQTYERFIPTALRFLTREEIDELFLFIEESNYTDIGVRNFIIAEDGLYSIDHEFRSFRDVIDWSKMEEFYPHISPEDVNYFKAKLDAKRALPQQRKVPYTSYSDMRARAKQLNDKTLPHFLNDFVKGCRRVGADLPRDFAYEKTTLLFSKKIPSAIEFRDWNHSVVIEKSSPTSP